jgi:threonine dehydratase
MKPYAADLDAIRASSQRIAGKAHVTPVVTCATLDRLAGRSLFFKCEHLQKAGAFKFRGACNAVTRLTPERRAVEEYGARVIECVPTLAAREETAAAVLTETGGTLIPPYNHPDVIAGQGTVALELLEQVPGLDAVVAPVGGGGLLAGVTIAARSLVPTMRVFAAEPAGADDAARSKAAGTLIPQTGPRTIADGLLTSLGDLTWPVLRDEVERVIMVREEEIVAAMRLAWQRAKLLIEPSSAVALAAVLSEEMRALPGMKRVGIVLSGGNVNLDALPW